MVANFEMLMVETMNESINVSIIYKHLTIHAEV